MTTTAMNCDVFNERLMAYLEHETDDATRVAMERHALECGDCGALLADLRKLRADAGKLPELKPSRDLWQGIAARGLKKRFTASAAVSGPMVKRSPIGTIATFG